MANTYNFALLHCNYRAKGLALCCYPAHGMGRPRHVLEACIALDVGGEVMDRMTT